MEFLQQSFPTVFALKTPAIMMGGRQVHTLTGHSYSVRSVAFSPNGNRVASGSDDSLVIWDTKTGALVSRFVGVCGGWRGGGIVFGLFPQVSA